ncbi:MAG TPA: transketolase, partial [Anaerolineae bacterium]|nr:transketolase [Anaerolineae bacterium]
MVELSQQEVEHLRQVAKTIRCHVVHTISQAGVGHPGGSLSEADILAALYFHVMRLDPQRPDWP